MYRRTWPYIFSLLALGSIHAHAQDDKKDKKLVYDTTNARFIPTGVRLGLDLMSIGRSRYSEKFKGWEVNGDIDFYRYYVTVDYGYWESFHSLGNGEYRSNGDYYRIGVDVNFLLRDPDRNMLFLGIRRGHSGFVNQATYDYTPIYFPTQVNSVVSTPTANWTELTAGLRVKLWRFLWMGATGRMKFGLKMKGDEELKPYDVPGFGLNFKPLWWGINYQLFVKIPTGKKK